MPKPAKRGRGRPPLSRGEETARMTVYLTQETLDRLRALPQPIGASARKAIEEYLERHEARDR